MGVKEALNHDLFQPYPVVAEKKGEIVAHFKYTVAILKNSTQIIAGLPIGDQTYKTENKIEDQAILDLIAVSISFWMK